MRSILQLRTPQSSTGEQHQLGGLNGKAAVEAVPSVVLFRDPQIEMAHGAGGKASRRLVEGLFAPLLFANATAPLGDAACIATDGPSIAITTDSFVVKPLKFPGGSIGELAVNGTMNDLAVSGAIGQAMVVTFVLEEGLPTSVLEGEVRAMAAALRRAGVVMVGGDTKVVERGKADGMYITTTGIGRPMPQVRIDAQSVQPGDKVLLSGPIGDHGITISSHEASLIWKRICLQTHDASYRWWKQWSRKQVRESAGLRDPTRGGVATSLNELARDCGLSIVCPKREIPHA